MHNAYPELPSLPYMPTSIPMTEAVVALQRLAVSAEVKRMAYMMFRNESSNGRSGINHNYCGAQADGARWPEYLTPLFAGTVYLEENGTGQDRIFLAFHDVAGCWAFLADRIQARGLYIGGTTSKVVTMSPWSPTDLARAYHKEWVKGDPAAEPSPNQMAAFLSMYEQARRLFLEGAP